MIILLQIGTQEFGEAFRIARRIASQGKKMLILFTGDGCRLAENPHTTESLEFARLYALGEDVRKPAKGVEVITYDGWVKLLEYSNKTACWT